MIWPFNYIAEYREMKRVLRILCQVHLRHPTDASEPTMIEVGATATDYRWTGVRPEEWTEAWIAARRLGFGVQYLQESFSLKRKASK